MPKPVSASQGPQFDYLNSKLMLRWDVHFKQIHAIVRLDNRLPETGNHTRPVAGMCSHAALLPSPSQMPSRPEPCHRARLLRCADTTAGPHRLPRSICRPLPVSHGVDMLRRLTPKSSGTAYRQAAATSEPPQWIKSHGT